MCLQAEHWPSLVKSFNFFIETKTIYNFSSHKDSSNLPQHIKMILAPPETVTTRSSLVRKNESVAVQKSLPTRCNGLNNQGNTCYMNAALQCMLHFLKPFLLSNEAKQHKHHLKNLCPLCEMTELSNSYFLKALPTSYAITPRKLAMRAQSTF